MTLNNDKPLLDATIRLDNIPSKGRTLKVKATAEQRRAIAQQLDIESLDRFEAELNATTIKGGIQIKGQFMANVTQLCVVSFVPVAEHIEESVDRIFLLGLEADAVAEAGSEVFVDLESDDLPDYFEGPEVDVCNLLLEVLALALEAHPRAPDAQLDNPAGDEEIEESPFAVLKQLKSTRD